MGVLEGKIAIVTGSSRGLGKATAILLAEAGCKGLLVNYLKDEKGAVSVQQRVLALGCDAIAVRADVSQADQVERMVDQAVARWGRIDILVNNAGVCRRGSFFDTTPSMWEHCIGVCLTGVFLCTKFVAAVMRECGGGAIVNVASTAGLSGGTMDPAYGAAKAGVIALTKFAARTLGPYNIRVNCVAPGYMDTDMLHSVFPEPNAVAERIKNIPLGRIGRPEEVAETILFLASERSSYVTGAVLLVSGGRS